MGRIVASVFQKIVVLESEVQAQVLDAILTDRGIPHVMHSYYDRAYDGVFQASSGWGHVEAPPRFREEILAVLQEMSRAPPASEAGSATEG